MTREWAQRRRDDEFDVVGERGDVVDKSLLDEQRQGVNGGRQRGPGWRLEGAGDTCGQDEDAVGAECDGLADRGVVCDSAVEEESTVDLDGGEDGWDGRRREHGGAGRSG